jgi:hypothetical protein
MDRECKTYSCRVVSDPVEIFSRIEPVSMALCIRVLFGDWMRNLQTFDIGGERQALDGVLDGVAG